MRKISLNSTELRPNKIVPAKSPRKKVSIKPFRINCDARIGNNLVVLITYAEFLDLLLSVTVKGQQRCVTFSAVDNEQSELPSAAQRTPTTDRTKNQIAAWGDSDITPEEKLESLRIFAYGGVVNDNVLSGEDTLLSFVDGAGRAESAERLLRQRSSWQGRVPRPFYRLPLTVFCLNIDISPPLISMTYRVCKERQSRVPTVQPGR